VDLKIRPAVAAISGALIAMLFGPPEAYHAIIKHMLTRIIKAEIYEKPGLTYPRTGKKKGKGKGKGKGNVKAQYQRRKQRKSEKRTKPG